MPGGSCLCGDFKYEWTGDAQGVIACHCLPCRKTSGSSNSINILVPAEGFKSSGKNFQYTRVADSGKNATYNLCAQCGGLLFVEAEAMPPVKIVKIGTVDEEGVLQSSKPVSEIYTKRRLDWCPIFDCPQMEGAPS